MLGVALAVIFLMMGNGAGKTKRDAGEKWSSLFLVRPAKLAPFSSVPSTAAQKTRFPEAKGVHKGTAAFSTAVFFFRLFLFLTQRQPDAAFAQIARDFPGARIVEMHPGTMWTRDYQSNRVRVAVDANGIVTNEPHVG